MDRRKALAVAATVGITLAAATAAVFANVSLLSGAEPSEGVGELDARNVADLVVESPDTTVVYVDEYVTVPATTPDSPTPAAPTYDDGHDDGHDDDQADHDDDDGHDDDADHADHADHDNDDD